MADVPFTHSFDLDTGAGTDRIQGVNLRISASGGSIEALGQKTAAASIPVVLASDQGSLTVDTELPAAAALTDDFANPTAPAVGAFTMVWDGSAWDRAPGTSADGLLVNLGANNDVTTEFSTNTAPAALTDNFANPTAMPIGAFGMVWDGATWDRMPGDSTDGVLVNLGANNDVSTELPAAAALTDNFANPTAPAVGAFGMLWDGATWDRAPGDSTDGALVNLGANNDVTTEFSTNTAPAALTDDFANPTAMPIGAFAMGWDSTNSNWNRVEVDDDGHLQVDILSGGGGHTATNPATEVVTATVSSEATSDLTTAELASTQLTKLVVWSSVAFKVRLYTVDNAVESTNPIVVGGGGPFQAFTWDAPHHDYVTLGATAGLDAYRAEVTNLDSKDAADIYATFHYEDV
jgi:hypothetical protein